jgi:predicted permease
VLAITLPIALCIGLGYFLTRQQIFSQDGARLLGRFVMTVAMPALIFNALANQPIQSLLNWGYLVSYTLASLSSMAISYLIAQRIGLTSKSLQGLFAMGSSCSNSGFIGYPIIVLAIGPIAGTFFGLNLIVENLLLLPLSLILAERKDATSANHPMQKAWSAISPLLRNPLFLAILLGGLFATFELSLPTPIQRTVQLFSQAAVGLALFSIGSFLAGIQAKGLGKPVAWLVVCKLIFHPILAAFIGLVLLPAEAHDAYVALVLFSAVPMLSIFSVVAAKYGHEAFASAGQMAAVLVSFMTLNALLWLFSVLDYLPQT